MNTYKMNNICTVTVEIPDLKLKEVLEVQDTDRISKIITLLFQNEKIRSLKNILNYGLLYSKSNNDSLMETKLKSKKCPDLENGIFLNEEQGMQNYSAIITDNLTFTPLRRIYSNPVDQNNFLKYNSRKKRKKFLELILVGDISKIEKYLKKGLDPNYCEKYENKETTPLISACKLKLAPKLLKILMANDAHPCFQDNFTLTPIHHCAIHSHDEALETLVRLGSGVDYKNSDGFTPLYLGVQKGLKDTSMRVLMKKGCDMCVIDKSLYTVLHHACTNDKHTLLKDLVSHGADINAKNHLGNTPLHLSAFFNKVECVRVLLELGCDGNLLNHDGKRAVEICQNSHITTILNNYNKNENNNNNNASTVINSTCNNSNNINNSIVELSNDMNKEDFKTGNTPNKDLNTTLTDEDSFHKQKKEINENKIKINGIDPKNDDNNTPSIVDEDKNEMEKMNFDTSQLKMKKIMEKNKKNNLKKLSFSDDDDNDEAPPLIPRQMPEVRDVVLKGGSIELGFVLCGAGDVNPTISSFHPSLLYPALQFFRYVKPQSPAFNAGVSNLDFLLEVNETDVRSASHLYTAELIKKAVLDGGDIKMKVVTVHSHYDREEDGGLNNVYHNGSIKTKSLSSSSAFKLHTLNMISEEQENEVFEDNTNNEHNNSQQNDYNNNLIKSSNQISNNAVNLNKKPAPPLPAKPTGLLNKQKQNKNNDNTIDLIKNNQNNNSQNHSFSSFSSLSPPPQGVSPSLSSQSSSSQLSSSSSSFFPPPPPPIALNQQSDENNNRIKNNINNNHNNNHNNINKNCGVNLEEIKRNIIKNQNLIIENKIKEKKLKSNKDLENNNDENNNTVDNSKIQNKSLCVSDNNIHILQNNSNTNNMKLNNIINDANNPRSLPNDKMNSNSESNLMIESHNIITSWSVEEVADWLASINMQKHVSSFKNKFISGKKLIEMKRNDFIALNMKDMKERMTIERAIIRYTRNLNK